MSEDIRSPESLVCLSSGGLALPPTGHVAAPTVGRWIDPGTLATMTLRRAGSSGHERRSIISLLCPRSLADPAGVVFIHTKETGNRKCIGEIM